MARRNDKAVAVKLRKQGLSYSQIKTKINVSKSTLSGWLSDMPLPKKKLRALQFNEEVIEKIRETKRKKREARIFEVYDRVGKDIGKLSRREIFLAGFFLYWGEGTKRQSCVTALANTDPAMIKFYLKWLSLLEIPMSKVSVRLHLYSDMNPEKEIKFWSTQLGLPKSAFRKAYIKTSKLSELTYTSFGHGTCNINVYSRDLQEYVIQGLKKITKDLC